MSYGPEVKRTIVEELESGIISIREAAQRGHTSVGRVKLWLEEYGKYKTHLLPPLTSSTPTF